MVDPAKILSSSWQSDSEGEYDVLLPRGIVGHVLGAQDVMEASFALLPEADTDEHWLVGEK